MPDEAEEDGAVAEDQEEALKDEEEDTAGDTGNQRRIHSRAERKV